MASKEDILEQLVEEFLIHRGYFVKHNVKFLPRKDHPDFNSKQDSNHSDIDVLGYNPNTSGPNRVWAVSCKSWQAGLNPASKISQIVQNKTVSGREAWRGFRELVIPKWSEAFLKAVQDATGETEFTYVTAVTRLNGAADVWEKHPPFQSAMNGNPIKIITLESMLNEVSKNLGTTVAGTEFGRTLQLFKAAGILEEPLHDKAPLKDAREEDDMDKLLTPGNGNQAENRKRAIEYIARYILDVASIDVSHGNITTQDGRSYHVSAYAESSAAFVSTPGVDKPKHSIYESGLTSLMYRQIKNDKRAFIYEVDPKKIPVPQNSSSASWADIEQCSSRIWICVGDIQKLIDRTVEE